MQYDQILLGFNLTVLFENTCLEKLGKKFAASSSCTFWSLQTTTMESSVATQ